MLGADSPLVLAHVDRRCKQGSCLILQAWSQVLRSWVKGLLVVVFVSAPPSTPLIVAHGKQHNDAHAELYLSRGA